MSFSLVLKYLFSRDEQKKNNLENIGVGTLALLTVWTIIPIHFKSLKRFLVDIPQPNKKIYTVV